MKHKAWADLLDGGESASSSYKDDSYDASRRQERRDYIYNIAFMCSTSFACGLVTSQRGPSILDLGHLTHSDLQHTTSLFALGAGGHLTGCIATGLVFDQFKTNMFLFWSLLSLCACTAAVPWCGTYGIMAAVYFLSLFCVGCVETGTYADVGRRWRQRGNRVLQLMQLTFVFGGVLSPALTQIFLVSSTRLHGSTNGNSAWQDGSMNTNTSRGYNDSVVIYGDVLPTVSTWNVFNRNRSDFNDSFSTSVSIIQPLFKLSPSTSVSVRPQLLQSSYNQSRNESGHDIPVPTRSKVYYAYAISAAVALFAAVPFIARHWTASKAPPRRPEDVSRRRGQEGETSVIALILVAALFFCVTAVEESLHQILFTLVHHEGRWSVTMAALLTSWFWCGMLLVRLAAYFLPDNVQPHTALFLSCLALPCALAGLHFSVLHASIDGVWASVFFAGMSCSLLFPASFTWLHACLNQKSGTISATVMLSSSAAAICNPLVIGHFFQKGFAIPGYLYLLLAEACGALLTFFLLFLLSERLRARWRKAETKIVLEKFVARMTGHGSQDTIDIESDHSS